MQVQDTPTGSFMRFFLGFLIFIGLSVGLTLLVNAYAVKQAGEQRAAAAKAILLEQH